jgi:pyruvate-ferredoxin/flavodoxin oxidoreductase
MSKHTETIDGNEAAASVAYKTNEILCIYPITPASQMGELCDAWNARGIPNVFGQVPPVIEMQSEGGVAGVMHGATQTGSLVSTFTSSQGLLLVIPNMYKIAGELSPATVHVSSRVVATHGLSIFVEHNDVMACRATGWAILFSGSVQEAWDFALISQIATLESRVPFLHAFDGFRTSHEVAKIGVLPDEEILGLMNQEHILAHRARSMSPERPVLRGSVQDTDVFWQGRERANAYFEACPGIVQKHFDRWAELTGRRYAAFEYHGAPDAERMIVLMGSSCETAAETVDRLVAAGERVGVLKVRLFRPFSVELFLDSVPPTVERVAVLDRLREQGAAAEPLYLDVMNAFGQAVLTGRRERLPVLTGGRYGIAGKEFTPAMVKRVLEELGRPEPRRRFVIGIDDDVNGLALDYDRTWDIEPDDVVRAVFWGLGADGTVSANKAGAKIIGDMPGRYVQAYFIYDSKKSGSITESHLRFGPRWIRSSYLISRANYIGVHQWTLLWVRPCLDRAAPGSTVLVNSPYGPGEMFDRMPDRVREIVLERDLKLYCIDAHRLAREQGLGGRISAIMQTGFFILSGLLSEEEAVARMSAGVERAYAHRGAEAVAQNREAIAKVSGAIHRVRAGVPAMAGGGAPPKRPDVPPIADKFPPEAPDIVHRLIGPMVRGKGRELPVSAMTPDGTFPIATTQWEKRNISTEAPVWDPELCTQCGRCILMCPHVVLRAKVVDPGALEGAPAGLGSAPAKWRELSGKQFVIGISAEDCTGCHLCYEACPAFDKSNPTYRAINVRPRTEPLAAEQARWRFFKSLPDVEPYEVDLRWNTVRDVQLLKPYFEFSGACAGCGETPYLGLVCRLFGDRMFVANAAGCSAVYAGNLPTTPFCFDQHGRGPTYNCSLFEDNAEFGMGYRMALDQQAERARQLVQRLRGRLDPDLAERLMAPVHQPKLQDRRTDVHALKRAISKMDSPDARELLSVCDQLTPRSVWIVGGDGWAYDIDFGGLDHVIASGANVNLIVLDTEVYSNTGGQMSKATARGAVVKFATGGKPKAKKDLGRMMMGYGHAYVASLAVGANDAQTVRAIIEAESFDGPSLLLCYSPCIAHGFDLRYQLDQQRRAVESGYWPLYRFDPRRAEKGKNPFQLDSKAPTLPLEEFVYRENRYRLLQQSQPRRAAELLELAKQDVRERWAALERLAG